MASDVNGAGGGLLTEEEENMLMILPPHEAEQLLRNMTHHHGAGNEFSCWMAGLNHRGQDGCPNSWDSLLCWPATLPNTSAVLPCFAEFRGIKYDTTQNASRWCHNNGTWDAYTNYSACHDLPRVVTSQGGDGLDSGIEVTSYIYFTGYALSLLALTIAISIFIYFKDLRCLRNTIHTNLMVTYMMADFMWILTLILQMSVQTDMASCIFLIILLHYFTLTNFFWMFVEGLYLYMLVVKTFYAENMKLKLYASIGWGGPIIFVISWAIAKAFTTSGAETAAATTTSGGGGSSGAAGEGMWKHCPWMSPHTLDWIFQAPAVTVLAVNLIFLLVIMWVLIIKLRSTNNVETQQYRKASKALVVLIPLLGTTYILVIAGPTEGISRNIYDAIRAILLSTQGFTVALFYCFLNTEVQNTLRHHLERWKESRSLHGSRRYRYHSKDWSPRSRTESIRLCTHAPNKRESNVSEATTTTMVGVNANGGRMSGGGGVTRGSSPFLQPPGMMGGGGPPD